jgi:catechol 2,3-dioxygenase-like lactoylglutathione lyase family enzyme
MASAIHVSLNVGNLEKSIVFYRGLFGEPAKIESDYAKFVGEDPPVHLALQPGPTGRSSGPLSHLGIRVGSPEEVQIWRERLRDRGITAGAERREECCYALQDKFWLTDPDGNRWEIYAVLEDLEVASCEGQTSCCAP